MTKVHSVLRSTDNAPPVQRTQAAHAASDRRTASSKAIQCRGMSFDEGERLLSPKAGAGAVGQSGGGKALPDDTRVQMERSMGADFSGVRVHEGGKADALGAEAFAQGEDIHFASGQYAPGGASGDALIGHELAHVVQQRAGRVAPGPQGKGAPINADRALEAEADRAGAAAARGDSANITGGGGAAKSGDAAPIQGNFGFEFEIGGADLWGVTWETQGGKMPKRGSKDEEENAVQEDKPKLPPKGFPIAAGTGFQLQAEDNGANHRTMEFVTNAPGLASPDAVMSAATAAGEMGKKIGARTGVKNPAFNASEIGGTPLINMKPGLSYRGMPQATAGIPLAAMPRFMQEVEKKGWGGGASGKTAVDKTRDSLPQIKEMLGGQEASSELQGFLSLLKLYIASGQAASPHKDLRSRRSFPKGQFAIMSRTNFSRIFGMLPPKEQESIKSKMTTWIQLVCGDVQSDAPISEAIYNYDETWATDGMSITTTREDWLKGMPEKDRLSLDGHETGDLSHAREPKQPNRHGKSTEHVNLVQVEEGELEGLDSTIRGLYEGIGAYGDKSDTVRYTEDKGGQEGKKDKEEAPKDTSAVLVELRNLPEMDSPSEWAPLMQQVFGLAKDAIEHPHGVNEGPKKEYVDVQNERQQKLAKEGPVVERQIQSEREVAKALQIEQQLLRMIQSAQGRKGKGSHTLGSDDKSPGHQKTKRGTAKGWLERKRMERKAKKELKKPDPSKGIGSDD